MCCKLLMKLVKSIPLNVRWTNDSNRSRSFSVCDMIKSYGAFPIKSIILWEFLIIIVRFPQAMVALRKPAISISSFCENKCGICTGSLSMKSSVLYCRTFSSRKSLSSDGLIIDWWLWILKFFRKYSLLLQGIAQIEAASFLFFL